MLIGLGIGLPFASAISLAAQIAALFAAGEQGVWYDPADFSTMFQDSAGTTPVTAAGQPVGLMLDKSKGLVLGPELVTNGTFDTDTVGYATYQATLAAVAGEMQITSAAADLSQSALMGLPVTTGKWYEVSATLRRGTNPGTVTLEVYDGVAQVLIAEVASIAGVQVSGTVQAKAMLIDVKMNCHTTAIGQTSFVDNISVRELPGNHGKQATSTARPLRQASPTRIDYDGVDDTLVSTFAASLGAACTVCRAVPGVGASILTAQTIGTSYTDSTDHSGLIIVNRALTAGETASVTAYLNQKAFA